MGWMVSWVGIQGVPKETVLDALGFVETGQAVDHGCRVVNFCVRQFDDWVIVFSEDFDWGSPKKALELSRLGRTVSLQIDDKVEMTAIACEALSGSEVWRVSHEPERGEDVAVTGAPPAAFERIQDRLWRRQEQDDGADYLHDIPIETVKAVCGFRADNEDAPFTALRKVGAPEGSEFWKRRGLLGLLFGRTP